jgi:amino-acid N-acetyltransferase
MKTRRARPEDVAAVYRIVAHYAAEGILLPRTEGEIRAHIERFLVLIEPEANGTAERVIGCVALEPYGPDLAEVRSLAVAPEVRGNGMGSRLLRFALAVAKRRKIARVFAVTHAPEFFNRQGFHTSTRFTLPEKLERDCRVCPKERTCKLVAVIATVCPKRVVLPVLAADAKTASAP